MSLLSKFSSFWRNLLHKTQIEQDLDEEARSYIEMLTDEKVKAGVTLKEARRAAFIEFGGLDQVKEKVRDVRVGVLLESLWYDLRYAARSLAKSRGFTVVAVLTLALGIGGTTAIFSLVYGAMLNPFPYRESHRLAVLVSHDPKQGQSVRGAHVSTAEFQDYREKNQVFDEVIGGTGVLAADDVITVGTSAPEIIASFKVTGNTFRVLGVPPLLGRTITQADCEPGAPPVAVLSHKLWRSKFAGDPGVVGRVVIVGGTGPRLSSASCHRDSLGWEWSFGFPLVFPRLVGTMECDSLL